MTDDSKYPSESADRFQVRLPDGMRDRIKRAAEFNNRSMNAEIVATLEKEYPGYMNSEDDFAGFYAEMTWLYAKARTKSEKAAALENMRRIVERTFPGKTVRRGFLGVPDIVDKPD